MRKNLFWLSDEQWARIEPHLPTDVRGVERADTSLRVAEKSEEAPYSYTYGFQVSGTLWCACNTLNRGPVIEKTRAVGATSMKIAAAFFALSLLVGPAAFA